MPIGSVGFLMSDAPLPPPQYPPARHSSSRVFAIVGAVAVFLAGVGLVAWVTLGRNDGLSHPDDWDPRVADIAQFVQNERGVLFEHPVHVDFLPDEEFTADVTASEEDLTDEDRASLEQAEALFRALGLAQGDVDLFEDQNQLSGEGIAAYYDPEDERIRVRGTDLTPDLRVTLAHELTHALQDQFIDLDEVEDGLEDGAASRFRAVVEGDATNVANAYADEELTDAEHEVYQDSSANEVEEADLEGVTPALVAFFQAPYALGPAFDRIVVAEDGATGLNNALREPPESDVQLLDPRAYFDGKAPETVDLPDAPEGAEVIEDGEFGALDWYVVLASRVDAKRALAVIDGWAGDSYTTYEDAGRVCVKARYRGTDVAATNDVAALLGEWTVAMRSDATLTDIDDRTIELLSCDPGSDAQIAEGAPVESLLLAPASRLVVTADLMDQLDLDLDDAWCVAANAVDALTLEELQMPELDADGQRRIFDVMAGCGVRPG